MFYFIYFTVISLYMCTYVYIYTCMYIRVCIYVCMYVCVCIYIYIYIYICVVDNLINRLPCFQISCFWHTILTIDVCFSVSLSVRYVF